MSLAVSQRPKPRQFRLSEERLAARPKPYSVQGGILPQRLVDIACESPHGTISNASLAGAVPSRRSCRSANILPKPIMAFNINTKCPVCLGFKVLRLTGKFPSIHWWGIIRLPSGSSMISFPTLAKVVHLQFDIALAAHRLCTLNLHTSHERPWEVTPDSASRQTWREKSIFFDLFH